MSKSLWLLLVMALGLLLLFGGLQANEQNQDSASWTTAQQTDVSVLIKQLKSSIDSKVRVDAAKALGESKQPGAVEPLIAALQDQSQDVTNEAAKALAVLGDSRAVEPLIQCLYMQRFLNDWIVSKAPMEALEKIGEPDKERLVITLKTGRPTLKLGVASTLEKMGWKPGNPEEEIAFLAGKAQFTGLEKYGKAAIPTLVLCQA